MSPGSDAGFQPSFYVEVLQSDALLLRLVDSSLIVAYEDSSRIVLLRDIYGGSSKAPSVRSATAVLALRQRITVKASPQTGIVRLNVRTRDANLSDAIARRLVAEVRRFDVVSRQSQAREERRFLEERLGDARDTLRNAEDVLQSFLQQNRDIANSPQLMFEKGRLERRMAERQQVVTTLADAYEVARLKEVREAPLLTIVESPHRPALPDSRFLLLKVVMVLICGCALMALLVQWSALFREVVTTSPARETLLFRWRQARSDFRRPWRLIKRG